VERLAHRAELRFEAGRLRAGDAERAGGRLGVEAEQMRAGRRRAKRADRAGRVEAARVVAGPQRHADAAAGLVAGDKRGDDRLARGFALLGEGQQRRQDRDRRMARHRQVDVVVVERMGDRAVDQRRRQHRQRAAWPITAACSAPPASLLIEQDAGERIVGAGEPDAEIVEHALPRELAHRLGQRVIGDGAGPLGEGAGEVCRC
jgi:hypothetical protein